MPRSAWARVVASISSCEPHRSQPHEDLTEKMRKVTALVRENRKFLPGDTRRRTGSQLDEAEHRWKDCHDGRRPRCKDRQVVRLPPLKAAEGSLAPQESNIEHGRARQIDQKDHVLAQGGKPIWAESKVRDARDGAKDGIPGASPQPALRAGDLFAVSRREEERSGDREGHRGGPRFRLSGPGGAGLHIRASGGAAAQDSSH
jgi:hypothetical protein